MIINTIWYYLTWYLRPLVKWFLRKTTRLCELQRICYGEQIGSPRILGVENSLELSRTRQIRELMNYLDDALTEGRYENYQNQRLILDNAVSVVVNVKRIKKQLHTNFLTSFRKCLEQILDYKLLLIHAETTRKTQYDSDNNEHEKKLLELWEHLMPQEKLSARVTRQWNAIGFQGDDPKTDFRGMGLLGLENLLYFAKHYTEAARHVLTHSQHPIYNYAFAIVGINITSMAYHLLKDGSLKTHMYNSSKIQPITMRSFHQLYCCLFFEFDKYWIESKPRNIMDFSRIYNEFQDNIRVQLADIDTMFKFNPHVDHV